MKVNNSSVDILSSKSSSRILDKAFAAMIGMAEEELWVSVESMALTRSGAQHLPRKWTAMNS